MDPARIVHDWHKAVELSDLVAVRQGFIAGAARLVPRLCSHDLSQGQTETITTQVEKIRATADWTESAVATGQFDLGDQLAQRLRDQGLTSQRARNKPCSFGLVRNTVNPERAPSSLGAIGLLAAGGHSPGIFVNPADAGSR